MPAGKVTVTLNAPVDDVFAVAVTPGAEETVTATAADAAKAVPVIVRVPGARTDGDEIVIVGTGAATTSSCTEAVRVLSVAVTVCVPGSTGVHTVPAQVPSGEMVRSLDAETSIDAPVESCPVTVKVASVSTCTVELETEIASGGW